MGLSDPKVERPRLPREAKECMDAESRAYRRKEREADHSSSLIGRVPHADEVQGGVSAFVRVLRAGQELAQDQCVSEAGEKFDTAIESLPKQANVPSRDEFLPPGQEITDAQRLAYDQAKSDYHQRKAGIRTATEQFKKEIVECVCPDNQKK